MLFAADDYRDGKQAIQAWNTPMLRLGVMPAAGLHTTARDMARFYQAMLNGGTLAGERICTEESITRARTPSYIPGERELDTNLPAHFGYGFHLGGYAESGWGGTRSTPRTFGHNGWATNMTFADPDRDALCIFLNNGMLADLGNHARMREISDTVFEALGRL
jgi:CubicO group peptidase (beta-lactamase class C family)